MIHPATELKPVNDEIGLGVFATRPIPIGSIVWILDELDQRLPLPFVRQLPLSTRRMLDHYGFLDRSGHRILCWDIGRYVNHACDPNVLPTPWGFEIAVRSVEAGEEVTNDYATLNLERGFRCHCGGPACRAMVRPDDFERFVHVWEERIARALPHASLVPQPLRRWLDDDHRRTLRKFGGGNAPAVSLDANRLAHAVADPLAYAAVPRRRRTPSDIIAA